MSEYTALSGAWPLRRTFNLGYILEYLQLKRSAHIYSNKLEHLLLHSATNNLCLFKSWKFVCDYLLISHAVDCGEKLANTNNFSMYRVILLNCFLKLLLYPTYGFNLLSKSFTFIYTPGDLHTTAHISNKC